MSTVTGTVVVAHPDGGSVLLLAGDAVPEWAEAELKGHPLVDADDAEGADLDLAEHDGAVQEDHDALAGQAHTVVSAPDLDVVTDAGQ